MSDVADALAPAAWVAGVCAAGAVGLLGPSRRVIGGLESSASVVDPRARSGVVRAALAGAAGIGGLVWLPGPAGWVLAALLTAAVWWVLGRGESRAERRARAAAAADLPHLVGLLAAVVRAGASPDGALGTVCAALPGPAADRLAEVVARLALGAAPGLVWSSLADDAVLAPLGRSLGRALETGAPVADEVDRLAAELGRRARAAVEDRARAAGVRAAVPLGVCLLPGFLLLGIVPVVGALLTDLLR